MKDYKDWSDITLKQFEDLKNITEVQDDWTMCNIIDYLFDVDSNNLTLTEFNEYVKKVDFLKKDLKPLKSVPEKMNINGIEYVTKANLAAITTAQYIDYQNYCKKKDVSYADVLSVFVMPEGHSYNDGYNIDTVKEDMLAMRVDFVVTLAFFFIRQF